MKSNLLKISVVTALLVASNVYAGNIITNADEGFTADKQYGFGGWNFENVDVFITDLNYVPLDPPKVFDISDGTYDTMDENESFESQITTDTEHRANLHGKDWPVGEPAGIKIINGDTAVKHGKPENCIMTSSYLSADDNGGINGYLDSDTPAPTLCSSDFQTHKRFKVNLLETTVDTVDAAGGYGKPVELIFNLDTTDTNTDIVRYQVLQKINNYTGKRLGGYKIEVLDGNGVPNDNLTLSIGIGEGDENDDGIIDGDIWEESELANMSHGLWGPVQKDRFDNGFFDYIRAYYPVTLENSYTISYNGEMQGGNYQEIFGNWLPSIWEPTGMFFDDDNDPSTDAVLEAFFGVAPGYDNTNPDNLKWWTRTVENPYGDPEGANPPIYVWSEPTVDDMARWSSSDLYATGAIEDVLNLGLNYIVNVGSNAAILEETGKDTFIIRITPYVDADQEDPIYVGVEPPSVFISSEGQVTITPVPTFTPGTKVTLSVGDSDMNLDANQLDELNVTVSGSNDIETVTLTETDVNSSVFTGKLDTALTVNGLEDGVLDVVEDGVVTVTYVDVNYGNAGEKELNATTIAHTYVTPTADAGEDISVAADEAVSIAGLWSVDPYYDDYVYFEWKDKSTSIVYATTATLDIPANTLTAGTYTLTFKVTDQEGKSATDDVVITVTDAGGSTGGGGGGCTYNPNSKNFDLTMLMMLALGSLYAFRRRFIK